MNEKVKFPHLTREEFEQAYLEAYEQVDECYRDDPIAVFEQIVANERSREQAREIIENRGMEQARRPEQVSKQDRELALKQAMMNWDE